MALFGNVSSDFTKTGGKGFLERASNFVSYFPVIGRTLAMPIGLLDTVLESGKWLFQGKLGSAATVLAAGSAASVVNGIPGSWWVNDILLATVGTNAGELARGATEAVVGGGMGLLGHKPTVLSSYPAAIGSIGSDMAQAGPGKFASGVSAQRGQDADMAYANYMSGEGGVHVNELQSANGRAA